MTFFFLWYIIKKNNIERREAVIREFSVKAKPSNNKARTLFIVFMLLAFVLVMLSTVVSEYRGIIAFSGVGFLTLSLLFYTKYILAVYYYDVMIDSSGIPLLVVRQQTGKRQSTLCRIALSEIVSIEREDKAKRKGHKTTSDYKKYSYLPTLDPDLCYRIIMENGYERAEILIEISEDMAGLLSSYVDEAKGVK